jgi:dihydroorotate dehydrogenase subfamily 1
MMADLSVQIGSLKLTNPIIAASGCFGYGVEYAEIVDLSLLGGVAVKGLFLNEREGHPPERIVETPAGMLNAIGLQGIGVHRFIREKLPELRDRRATVIVNICGSTLEEYVDLARILSDADGVAALELNISCPNIKEGGITFGCSLAGTFDVVSAVRKVTRLPVIPKLTPNVTDVASFARAAEEAGADAVLVDGLKSLDTVRQLSAMVPRPFCFNQIARGKSPPCTLTELRESGVKLVIYSTPCLFAAQAAIDDAMVELVKVDGSLAGSRVGVKDCTRVLSENLARRSAPELIVHPPIPASPVQSSGEPQPN